MTIDKNKIRETCIHLADHLRKEANRLRNRVLISVTY